MFVLNNCRRDSRVLKEAKTLSDVGHDVRVVAVLDSDTEPYEERDGFRIIRVGLDPLHYRAFRAMSRLKRLITRSRSASLRAAPQTELQSTAHLDQGESSSHVSGHRNPEPLTVRAYRIIVWHLYTAFTLALSPLTLALGMADYCQRACQAIKDEPADVYHSHDLTTLPAGYLAKRRLGGRLVYDSHELFTELRYISTVERLLFRLLERCLIRRADAVITVNDLIARALSNRYGINMPTVVMNCPASYVGGNDQHNDSLRAKLGLDDSVAVILYVGGLIPGRGLENLILAAPLLLESVVVMLGWGSEEDGLREFVGLHGLEDKVLFAPPVAAEAVVEYIRSASVGVIPTPNASLNHYYTSPNKLFEYINAGLPVVCSDLPVLRTIVEGYHLGRTCNSEKPEDIAAAANWVLADRERYEAMKKNALEAAKVFNWEAESLKLLKLYEGLGAVRSD